MSSSDMSDETNPGQSIVKLAEGAETGMLNATHITRECDRITEDLELVRGEDLRRAVARELMKRDDSGDLADEAREIMSKTDVEMDPWADVDPCPGCGRQWHQASYEYHGCDYGRDDETWCRECAAAHADDDELDDNSDEIADLVDEMIERNHPNVDEEREESLRETIRSYLTGGSNGQRVDE